MYAWIIIGVFLSMASMEVVIAVGEWYLKIQWDLVTQLKRQGELRDALLENAKNAMEESHKELCLREAQINRLISERDDCRPLDSDYGSRYGSRR